MSQNHITRPADNRRYHLWTAAALRAIRSGGNAEYAVEVADRIVRAAEERTGDVNIPLPSGSFTPISTFLEPK